MIKEYPCIKNVYIISQVCFQIKLLIFFYQNKTDHFMYLSHMDYNHRNVTLLAGDLGTPLYASYISGLQARLGLKQAAKPSFTPPGSPTVEWWSILGLFSFSILRSRDSPSPSSARREPMPLRGLRLRRLSGFSRNVKEAVPSLSGFPPAAVPCGVLSGRTWSGLRFLLLDSFMVPMVMVLFSLSKLTWLRRL